MYRRNLTVILLIIGAISCMSIQDTPNDSIEGYDLLTDINGHWIGTNDTAFGSYDWFAFDFRPISPSHSHSIYEGGTNQNIITSLFLADFEGRQQIMARNGGWLGNQYRATYFVLDRSEVRGQERSYRLVDAVGGVDRAYIEFKFFGDSIHIDAYKDNSGSLDQPIHHMGFKGENRNPSYAENAKSQFDYPQPISEVDLDGRFMDLIDPDSALFLEEADDPFPKADHGYLSDCSIDILRDQATTDVPLLLYLSLDELVSLTGAVDYANVDNTVVRTIDIRADEDNYLATYIHPDDYYMTIFLDRDDNGYPSTGDLTSVSTLQMITPETLTTAQLAITLQIP